jgi:hypothetical protein
MSPLAMNSTSPNNPRGEEKKGSRLRAFFVVMGYGLAKRGKMEVVEMKQFCTLTRQMPFYFDSCVAPRAISVVRWRVISDGL